MSIESPCKDICKIHPEIKICVGCYRTRLEIAQWHKVDDTKKQHILVSIAQKQKIYGELCLGC